MEKTIMIGIGAPAGEDYLAEDVAMAEQADEEMFEAMAPKGDFTQRGLQPLVRATNKLLPMFGQTPDYPEVEDTNQLPTDFTRVLAMFSAAVEEAIEDDVVSPEMMIDLSQIRDDSGLLTIAGKLDMLSQDREFKRYLSEEAPERAEPEEMDEYEEEMPMSEEEEDMMMMERL